MSARFADESRLKSAAKSSLLSGTSQLERWWCKKHNRPPGDPLYAARSSAEHRIDWFADLMLRREDLLDELKNGQGVGVAENAAIMQTVMDIDKALGDESEVEDPKVAEWEAALDRGEEPDI